jgi:hypothetical protein
MSFVQTYKVPLIIAALVAVVLLYLHFHNKSKDAKEKTPGGKTKTKARPAQSPAQSSAPAVTDNATDGTSDINNIPVYLRNPDYVAPGSQGTPLYDTTQQMLDALSPGDPVQLQPVGGFDDAPHTTTNFKIKDI